MLPGSWQVQRLTTNVTGHFAFFVAEVFRLDFNAGFIYFLYIFFFFLGSFCSSFMVEFISRRNDIYSHAVPTSIEIVHLALIAVFGENLIPHHPDLIAFILLFAMGLQNSLVTKISGTTVRTTHLTGLFTDLGIDLSQLFFYRHATERKKLLASIKLRFTIISFFFTSGVIGGIFYSAIGLQVLLFGVLALITRLIYDNIKLRLFWLARKLTN